MLQGRVGVVSLVTGFALQALALVLPSVSGVSWLSFPCALLAVFCARTVGNGWIRRRRQSLFDEVLRSGRLTVVIEDVNALRRTPRSSPPWHEPQLVRLLERFVCRP